LKRLTVDVDGVRIGENNPVRLMGIINLSPESFYKGTIVTDASSIKQIVTSMEAEGADLIDIGAASTAPKNVYGTSLVPESEELNRLTPVLRDITNSSNLPISIDTTSSKVAETALDMGVALVNDISGLRADPEMAKIVGSRDVPTVIMANCGTPCTSIHSAIGALEESLTIADKSGIKRENIILDPGIGFGKPAEIDFEILQNLQKFVAFNQPLLVGVSRKAFIGSLLNQKDPAERLYGSLAATAIAVYNGAKVIRTHDVKETKLAIQIAESILQ